MAPSFAVELPRLSLKVIADVMKDDLEASNVQLCGLSGPLVFKNHVRALGVHHSAAFASDQEDQLLNMPFLPCTGRKYPGFGPMARKITPSFVLELPVRTAAVDEHGDRYVA